MTMATMDELVAAYKKLEAIQSEGGITIVVRGGVVQNIYVAGLKGADATIIDFDFDPADSCNSAMVLTDGDGEEIRAEIGVIPLEEDPCPFTVTVIC